MIIPVTITKGGGGSAFGYIVASFPAATTSCTCSSGGTVLEADAAGLARGQFVFEVPAAGTWTVTISNGTDTNSETVSITAAGQAEVVKLGYVLYLFKAGTGVLTGYSVAKLESKGNFSKTDYIEWATTSQTNIGNEFQFQPAVDFSKYKTLFIDLQCTGRYSSSQTVVEIAITEKFRSGENIASTWDTLSKVSTNNDSYNTNRHTVSIDVTAITSSSYVTIRAFGISGKLYNVWLK